jgi:nucleotide-binding universal stress UspA family protein
VNALLTNHFHETYEVSAPNHLFRIRTIVAPLDGNPVSKAALPVARTLAELENAVLHVVYVGAGISGPHKTLAELGLTPEELHGAVLDELKGDPAAAIVSFAQSLSDALIVMCTQTGALRPVPSPAGVTARKGRHDAASVSRTTLGSLAEAVLRSGPERVLLVSPDMSQGDGQPWQLRRIVMAHDGTPTSDLATAPASELAHRAGGEVIALHVAARNAKHHDEPGSMPAPRYLDQPHHEWPAWAGSFVERMMALGAPPGAVNFKLLVTGGQPGSEIAQFAREHGADLVVMAWHGNWNPNRNGPLETIVRRSGCPVLLVSASRSA